MVVSPWPPVVGVVVVVVGTVAGGAGSPARSGSSFSPQPAAIAAAPARAASTRAIARLSLIVPAFSGRPARIFASGPPHTLASVSNLRPEGPPVTPPQNANLAAVTHLRPVPDPRPREHGPEGETPLPSIAELERWATVLRIDCVSMLAVAKSGHLDSSLSAADVVAALYYRVLRHDPENPGWPERDRFVLCKGHAAPIQYAALAHHGYFPREDLMGLRQIGAQLQGHPDMNRTPGIEVSTGSLGQGLSMCVGIALALRLDGLDDTAQVFGVLSDGDCQEGQTWEAATAAPHFGLTNVTAIVDYNHLQTDGTTEEVMDTGDVRGEVRGLRLGRGRDRRPRHGGRGRGARAQPDPRRPGGDRLPDEEGQGRLGDGGQVRLPRQAAEPGAGRGGARGAGGPPRGADRRRSR